MQVEARDPEDTASNPLSISIDQFAKLGFETPLEWQTLCEESLDGATRIIDRTGRERHHHFSYDGPDIAEPIERHQYNGRDVGEDGNWDERDGAEERNMYPTKEYSSMPTPPQRQSSTGIRKRQSDYSDLQSDSNKRRKHKENASESHAMGSVASYELATGVPPNLIETSHSNLLDTKQGGTMSSSYHALGTGIPTNLLEMTHLNLLETKQGGTITSSPHTEDITAAHCEKNSNPYSSSTGKKRKISGNEYGVKTKIRRTSMC